MATDLNPDMIHVMLSALMEHIKEIVADNATVVMLTHCKDALEWLDAQAQAIDSRPETAVMFSTSISAISQLIDQTHEQTRAIFAEPTHNPEQVAPLNLVKLCLAWDREFPGGSVAVMAQLEDIMSAGKARRQDQHNSSGKKPCSTASSAGVDKIEHLQSCMSYVPPAKTQRI